MTTIPSTLLDAVAFAARAHDGQLRKDQTTPYVSHVMRVCLIVRHVFGFDEPRMLITALLHDTIEDTTTDFDDVEEKFGRQIADWVALLTKNKGLPEKEREADYISRLKAAPWQVQACKLADVYDNLSDTDNLPSERRSHSIKRAETYFTAIKAMAADELQEPLRLVGKLIDERKRET